MHSTLLILQQIASVSGESFVSFDYEVKTDVPSEPTAASQVDSIDTSTAEAGDGVLHSSTDSGATATAGKSPTFTSPPLTSGGDRDGDDGEARSGEAELQSRRRGLWGTRIDAGSVGQEEKLSVSLISFSTDTLEKIVPTLTVPDRGPLPEDAMASAISNADAASDVSMPVTTSSLVTVDSCHLSTSQSAKTENELTPVEYDKNIGTGQIASGGGGGGLTVDEEVVVMDATIEGGLDIEAPALDSQKPAAVEEVDHRHLSARNLDTRQVTRKRSVEAIDREKKQSPLKRKGLKETKAVGYLIEQPERVEPCQVTTSPHGEFVHITCLVRPFTASQLKQMITSSFGPVVDLWLNRIKSAAVVHFESKQAAISCREGLDGSRWPSINPRVLRCDFISQEFFDWMKQYGDMTDMNPPKHLLSGAPATAELAREMRSKAENGRVGPVSGGVGGHPRKPDDLRQKLSRRDGEAKPSERTEKPGDAALPGGQQTKSEPSKMLDDLFRKTTTSPCIYWLPLTDEEAKQHAAERADLATKRGVGTRATRSPFAAGGESQRTEAATPIDKPVESENKTKKRLPADDVGGSSAASRSARPATGSGTLQPPSVDKVTSGGRQPDGRGSNDQKEHRRDGSPFMSSEKKSESASRPLQKPGLAQRDGLSGTRRQRSSSSSSSPSPKRPSRRPRLYREASPRRQSGLGDHSRRRSTRSRSRSTGGVGGPGRYRGRMDSSADAYRRYRGSSPYAHRSRR